LLSSRSHRLHIPPATPPSPTPSPTVAHTHHLHNHPHAQQGEERVDKKNVFNYELEGFEWDYCPSILMYTREVRFVSLFGLGALFGVRGWVWV
jgi:hypothetical protein